MRSSLFLFVLFAVNTSILSQPVSLQDTTNRYDYIIITTPEFVSACSSFKAHKEEVRDFDVLVVDTSQIFAEFNSSQKPEENIREFISYAGTYWREPLPKYFLIAGDLEKIPNKKFLYSFFSLNDTIETDYYYTQSIYDNNTIGVDFYVGRVSANNELQLGNYFAKVIEYESDINTYTWQNNTVIVADDKYTANGYEGDLWERQALQIGSKAPNYINVKYIFSADSSTYSGNKDTLINYSNINGVSSMFFVGHGNDSQFTHEAFLTLDDLSSFTSEKYFVPFFYANQKFSKSYRQSIINKMIVSENLALCAFNSVGITFSSDALSIAESFIKNLYSEFYLSMGEVQNLVLSENNISSFNDRYNIFGDPSIKLKYDLVADVIDENNFPGEFTLYQNYPNPFNPETKISFAVANSGNITLKIYDVLGNEVAVLADRFYAAGKYTIDFNASSLSSGIYFYTLKSGSFVQSKKMILIK